MKFTKLAVSREKDLVYGKAPHPVKTARGLLVGGGTVHPELNLTVPEGTVINRNTLPDLKTKYADAVRGALERAVALESKGFVIEFETLLEMTVDPFIGVELVKVMNEVCEEFYGKYKLPCEIRLTPNDARDFNRPPIMRSGQYLDSMFELFDKGSKAGGDLLSIESTGGKEVCDEALLTCDIQSVVFALGVLGVRDMRFLWGNICRIAAANGKIAGGDTACGFGNTAMVLAEKQYIPRVFAAVVRAATAVRSLVAIEEGATGPDKDCAYEGVFLKAIAGIPVSMEGKTAACAHLSPVGNIAAACADLWSNESVQNIKLLGGMAPTVYFEQLEYDCRLMNTAAASPKGALTLRDWLVKSDAGLDPQALVLAPESVIAIAGEIVRSSNHLEATVRASLKALSIIDNARRGGSLRLPERELEWIERIGTELSEIPWDEAKFTDLVLPRVDQSKVLLSEYGL